MDWLYEYDEKAHIEMIQKEFYEVGFNEGKSLGKQIGIDSVILGSLSGGSSPEDIAKITHIPLKQVMKVANTLEQ